MLHMMVLIALIPLLFLLFGGIVSSKAATGEESFFSIPQTNWLRSIAIVMIMLSHYFPHIGLDYASGFWSMGLWIGFLGVAIFLLLSGYSMMISKISKPNYLKRFLPKRLFRLYIPFLLTYVLSVILIFATGNSIKLNDILFIPLMSLPNTLNWYLKVQLCLYIIFYILAKLIKNNNALIGAVFSVCIVYTIVGLLSGIDAFWYESSSAFPLGMIIANYKSEIYRFLSKRYFFTLPTSLLLFIICLAPYFFRGGTLFEMLFIFGVLQFVICICIRFAGNVTGKVFSYLGVISLELYLSHGVILDTVGTLFDFTKYSIIFNILAFVAFMISSILLATVVNKISKLIIMRFSKN